MPLRLRGFAVLYDLGRLIPPTSVLITFAWPLHAIFAANLISDKVETLPHNQRDAPQLRAGVLAGRLVSHRRLAFVCDFWRLRRFSPLRRRSSPPA